MSIQATIAILKTLEVVDSRIRALSLDLTDKRHNMDEKAGRHVALVTKIASLEGVIERMEGTRNELHGELRQLNIQVDKAREKLTRCRNEREANAAQRELEEIRRLARERDFEIQKLVGLIDEARGDLTKVDEERAVIASQIDETAGEVTEQVRVIEGELAAQTKKRDSALSELPRELRGRYEAVTSRRGSGVSAIVDGSCTACHISLSPMLYQEIMRQQELFQCPSCHRILYVTEQDASGGEGRGETAAGASDAGDDSASSGS